MLSLNQLLNKLNYDKSSHYHLTNNTTSRIETAHLFRTAKEIGVHGIYVFKTSPASQNRLLPPRPAVYVAEAKDEKQAKEIHRSLWNLNYAPFIIIRLPHQIRVYTGFNYSEENSDDSNEIGLLYQIKLEQFDTLKYFKAEAIDTGQIWQAYQAELDPTYRVDERLLDNLDKLGKVLENDGLSAEIAYALIGKYVYISYLRDRNILDDDWLAEKGIEVAEILTHQANIPTLRKLIMTLENEINGQVFPIDFNQLTDKYVSWVASIFRGDEFVPDDLIQLHLPFKAYDFRYIPVETLSSIYEQFIHPKDRKRIGAIYTPEVLADYLLSEMEWAKPLEPGMRVLDPACGSGIFLALAYRRLIEKELANQGKIKLLPKQLANILTTSIYGVEREKEACYITEFSLILTLFHYAEPSELQKLNFKLPNLHDNNIFEADFFDIVGEESKVNFWDLGLRFDWIVGNPPWIDSKRKQEKFADAWIQKHKSDYSVGGNSVAQAFSWLVTKLLNCEDGGMIGLVMPATSLFNHNSKKYRQSFFTKQIVYRITNFANLRETLFDNRTTYPAATFIYQPSKETEPKPDILHYGPFTVHQLSERIPKLKIVKGKKKPWVIIINESEIKTLSPYEAENGETSFWKLALWGIFMDKRIIERIEYTFPTTLGELCKKKEWAFHRNIELRNWNEELNKLLKEGYNRESALEKLENDLEYAPELKDSKLFQVEPIRQSMFKFSIPEGVLKNIPDEMCYIRKRGGKAGLKVSSAPHIILSPIWMSYFIYSNQDFLMAPKHIGISGQKDNIEYLRAISIYLNSNLVSYCLFFYAHEWGVFRQANWVSPTEVRQIPIPEFSADQINQIAKLQKEIAQTEREQILEYCSKVLGDRLPFDKTGKFVDIDVESKRIEGKKKESIELFVTTNTGQKIYLSKAERKNANNFVKTDLRPQLQQKIDDTIYDLFNIPNDIRLIVEEFIKYRLPLDKPTVPLSITNSPDKEDLLAYAIQLRDKLDDFLMGEAYHRVTISKSDTFIVCKVEISDESGTISITENSIENADLTMAEFLSNVSDSLKEQISQWVYVQRGLRLFEGNCVFICKAPRMIDWTRTQAIQDGSDIIGQIVEETWSNDENRSFE